MNITILTLGTRGDVQPYLALALGLRRAGHVVTLGTSHDFENMARNVGISFYPFEFSVRKALEDADARAAFVSKRAAIRLYRKVSPLMPRLLDDAWQAAQDAQALLFHPKILNGLDIAEKLSIPSMVAFYMPGLSPTGAFPAPFIPGPASWGPRLNRLSHDLFLRLLTAPYHRFTNRWRIQTLGLPPRPFWTETTLRYGRTIPKLYGYSPHLVPTPADWDESAHVTGQWFLREDSLPPRALTEFLNQGPPPVAVGFGSITSASPERTTQMVIDALRLAGQRGVLIGGWGGLQPTVHRDSICFVESVAYDWLFARVSAVVHHGGAGSTAESMFAGKPAIICPFFGDQPFWGKRVHALGAGPPPIPQKKLTTEALARAIRTAVSDPTMRECAAALGAKIRTEDGVARAVEVVHRILGPPRPRS